MMKILHQQNEPCKYCGCCDPVVSSREYYQAYFDLWEQTPKEVWKDYLDNGYTMAEALLTEWQYA